VLELPREGFNPQFMPRSFLSEIGHKFQSLCKISNISTPDPQVLFRLILTLIITGNALLLVIGVLWCSVESGDLKVLQFALSAGVKPSVDVGGRTVLMQAARAGNRPATVYLLDHAAELQLDPHAVDTAAGESALFYGVRSGSVPVVDALLDNARHCLTSNSAGLDPVDCALSVSGPGASDVLRTLLDRFPDAVIRRRGEAGVTVLHRFVERGQMSMLRRYAPNNYKPGSRYMRNTYVNK